jgi:hypothetical protein
MITPEMTEAFHPTAADMDEFHFGRFDVRVQDIEELRRERGFAILEVNGAGAEVTPVWDRKTTLRRACTDLMEQYRLLWQIGSRNAKRGFKAAPMLALLSAHRHETSLWTRYPLTE